MLKMVDFLFCVFCYNLRKRDPHMFGPETTLPHPCLGVPGTRQALDEARLQEQSEPPGRAVCSEGQRGLLRGEEAGAGPPVPEEAASEPPSQLRRGRPRRTPTPGTTPSVSWATAEGAAPRRPARRRHRGQRDGRGGGGGRDTVPLGLRGPRP